MTAADERIAKLLERAGSSQIIVLNTVESYGQQYEGFDTKVDAIIARDFHGDAYAFMQHLVDVIDVLEGTLEDVLNRHEADLLDE